MRLFPVIRRLAFGLALGVFAAISAQAGTVDVNVPAQRADRALVALSQQARVEILFSSDALRQAKSSAVSGRFESKEALERLLQGSGFVAQENGPGKFVVVRAVQATGAVHGQLRLPDNSPAKKMRVGIVGQRQSVVTDKSGEFTFEQLPEGRYEIVAGAASFQPLSFGVIEVRGGTTVELPAKTLQPASDPTKLEPFLVLGNTETERPYNRRGSPFPPKTAISNLDLNRTENDVLPFTIYDRDQIERSGVTNLNAFLQRELLDADSSSAPPEQSGGLGTYTFGSGNLRLRGYGEDETIILVNGRRLPEVVTNLSSLQSSYRRPPPDVNLIPLSLVDRVEVLSVAASALYSGNPVGGVINIVLRPDAEGTEINGTYTNALGNYDAPQSTFSLQHGRNLLGGALRLRFNASFSRSVSPTEAELGYIRANQALNPAFSDLLSSYRATPNVSSTSGASLFGAGTASFTSVAPGANGSGGLDAFTGRQGVRSTDLFDTPGGFSTSATSKDYSYGRNQEGATYYGSATYTVTPWLEWGVDGKYSKLKANRGYDVLYGTLFLGADSPFNPFHQPVQVSLNEVAPALGENYSESRLESYSALTGLLLKLPRDWRVSIDGQYSHSETSYRGLASTDLSAFQNLVDAGIYNPLRDTQRYAPPPQFYDQMLFYGGRGRFAKLGSYETFDAAVRVSNQSLALPTGKGAINFGADYRLARLGDYDWSRRYGNGTLLDSETRLSGRSIARVSTFAELQAPLVPAKWLPRGLRSLEFDVAARYTTADTSEETNIAPTGGLKLDLAGGFSLRGTVATSNRFPSPLMSKAVSTATVVAGPGGGESSLMAVADPRRGGEAALVTVTEGITPNLKPEAAITRTAGIVFQRGREHRFRASLDFTDTEKSGEITTLDANEVLTYESVLPGRVTRAQLLPGDSHSVGRIVSITTGTFNLARRHSQNWTTSLDYSWRNAFGGQLDLYSRWAYFQRYDLQVMPNSPLTDELNYPDRSELKLLKHRVNFGAGWFNSRWGATLDSHYFHSRKLQLSEQLVQGTDSIRPFWQFDGSVQTDVSQWLTPLSSRYRLRLQLRVNNLFDAAPPRYVADPLFTGVQSYGDWRGRVYSLSFTTSF